MAVRSIRERPIFYAGYQSLVQIIYLRRPEVTERCAGVQTQPLIATFEPGAVVKSPVNHAYRGRGAAVESKRRAVIHVATEPDDGVLDLLGAMSSSLSDEPMYLGQNVGPTTNVADLIKPWGFTAASWPRCSGNHNSVYATRHRRPF